MCAAILFTSLQLRLAEPYHVVQQKLPTYTTWYGRCHLVSSGTRYVRLAEPYHVVPLWFHSNPALHRSMGFKTILFHFLTQYRRQYAM